MEHTETFEAQRPRLLRLAVGVLNDRAEAEDAVQEAWLRLQRTDAAIENLRLADDRDHSTLSGPAASADSHPRRRDRGERCRRRPGRRRRAGRDGGVVLQVVLDRLTPTERVAFVLHDSFGFEFSTIASVLATTPVAARKLASRARAKVRQPPAEDPLADWEVIDAFMAAAREGDFDRLLRLLAPDAAITADDAAILTGTPVRIEGRLEVAAFFRGGARAAVSVFTGDPPGAAWFHRGQAKVLFDFTVSDGLVHRITFRADPTVLALATRRDGEERRS